MVTQDTGASIIAYCIKSKKETYSVIESVPESCYYIGMYRVFYGTKGGFPDGFPFG